MRPSLSGRFAGESAADRLFRRMLALSGVSAILPRHERSGSRERISAAPNQTFGHCAGHRGSFRAGGCCRQAHWTLGIVNLRRELTGALLILFPGSLLKLWHYCVQRRGR